MKRRSIYIFLLTLCMLQSAASAQAKWSTYLNSRFGYSLEYPATVFVPQPEAENGDGRVFLSKDGTAELRVWGQYNALKRSVDQEYKAAVKSLGGHSTYVSRKGNTFVVSGIRDGRVFYRKTFYRRADDAFCTLLIEYPESAKSSYDQAVTRISRSFK